MFVDFEADDSALPGNSRAVPLSLAFAILALVAASLFTYWAIHRREEAIAGFTRFNVAQAASEAAIDFQRLQQTLLTLGKAPSPTALADAQFRLEIARDRVRALAGEEFSTFIHAERPAGQTLTAVLNGFETMKHALSGPLSEAEVGKAIAVLLPLQPKVIALAADAARYRNDEVAAHRLNLRLLHRQFSALTFAVILCSLYLVAALAWHNRLLTRAHRRLRAAADELSAANRAVASANDELRQKNRGMLEKEQELQAQNVLFDAALNNMSQGLCVFDADLRPVVCNARFRELLHPVPSTVAGAAPQPSPPDLRELLPEVADDLLRRMQETRSAAFETECADGRIMAVSLQPMPDGRWVATFTDVSEQRRAQARITHMARHDGLTNLPNRYAFRESMQRAFDEAVANEAMLAVMCLDIDNFKEVNDTLGHPAGDALLCAVADRLTGSARDSDMVARFGGDEFAILLPMIARYDDAERVAARLVEEMRKPFLISGEMIYATASVGVAIGPAHGRDPDELQKNADLALYAAKGAGRRTFRLFQSEMDERLARRHALERDLRGAVAAGEFELCYQPIVDLGSGMITGMEALLRWRHPVHGFVPPSKFIPVAEDAGLINEIGRWVLIQACADAATWPQRLKLSVNLSAAQFTRGDIVEDIRLALSRAGLRPERLIVEITETLLLTESATTLQTLHRLKALHVGIAMDDFGTGYSSLSYLRKYAFDRIKIDRDFVSSAKHSDKNPAIIHAIVQLGASLGMTTVAEGIETDADLKMLIAAGCDEGQGYLFSPPVPRDHVLGMVGTNWFGRAKVLAVSAA